MNREVRVRIVCEDRLSERFLGSLCERFHLRVIDVDVAPSGRGAGSNWVTKRYPGAVKLRRAQRHQANLGLLVHIDGDDCGVEGRKRELDHALEDGGLPPREASERIAVLVPTWCTEAWLLHLSGIAQPPESEKLKRNPVSAYQSELRRLASDTTATIKAAVQAWPSSAIPSLSDGHEELQQVLPQAG